MGTSREEFGEANIIRIYDFDRNKNPPICQSQQAYSL